MYRRILVPLDGSALAEMALPHAEWIASSTGAELDLVRISIPRFVPGSNGFVVQEDGDREEAEQYLAEWQERLKIRGLNATCHRLSGNVAQEIVAHAAASGVDLIVMTTHGLTGRRLWTYGSIAYEVLKAAPCCVLVVRG